MSKEEKIMKRYENFLTNRKYSALKSMPSSIEVKSSLESGIVTPLLNQNEEKNEQTDDKNSNTICIELSIGDGVCENLVVGEGAENIENALEGVSKKYKLKSEAKEKLKGAILQSLKDSDWLE